MATLGATACAALVACSLSTQPPSVRDWLVFGSDVAHSSAPATAGLTRSSVASLHLQQVMLDGTVDGSAVYVHGASVEGSLHNAFFVTTTYGKTIAIDADDGAVLWEYTPASYTSLAGTYQITNATPVVDGNRAFLYAASPDGVIRKLSISDGSVIWATAITLLPAREKIASPLTFFGGKVIAATNGYAGDTPPYQGHVAILDAATGSLQAVWNSLCSNQSGLLNPAACAQSDSGIWGRAGVAVDSSTGDLFVATGNGLWDGAANWGDSVIELSPDATQVVGNYTPADYAQLDQNDLDLGSTSPVLLGNNRVAQGGKDGIIRVIDWSAMRGATSHVGGEASTVPTPSGADLFTAPAVLSRSGATWLFAADGGGTSAWTLVSTSLQLQWHVARAGTSPVVTDGLLIVYDPNGALCIYDSMTGSLITSWPCGAGHWNSPIAVDGRIALPEGNANSHLTTGILDIWRE